MNIPTKKGLEECLVRITSYFHLFPSLSSYGTTGTNLLIMGTGVRTQNIAMDMMVIIMIMMMMMLLMMMNDDCYCDGDEEEKENTSCSFKLHRLGWRWG